MKNYHFITPALMLALLAGATSCSNDFDPWGDGEATAHFVVQMGDNVDSRAIGDGTSVDLLRYDVYDSEGNYISALSGTTAIESRSATVDLRLVRYHDYTVVFWAQNTGCDAYVFDTEHGTLTVDYTDATAADDTRDAFYATTSVCLEGGDAVTPVSLKRPFAQINLLADDAEGLTIASYSATATFTDVPNVLNIFDGTVSGSATATFTATALPTDIAAGYEACQRVAMAYLLAGTTQAATDATLVTTDGTVSHTSTIANLPLIRNYRTNLAGSFLTQNVSMNCQVSEAAREFIAACQQGGTVTVDQDLDLTGAGTIVLSNPLQLTLNADITTDAETLFRIAYSAPMNITDEAGFLQNAVVVAGTGTINAPNGTIFELDNVPAGGDEPVMSDMPMVTPLMIMGGNFVSQTGIHCTNQGPSMAMALSGTFSCTGPCIVTDDFTPVFFPIMVGLGGCTLKSTSTDYYAIEAGAGSAVEVNGQANGAYSCWIDGVKGGVHAAGVGANFNYCYVTCHAPTGASSTNYTKYNAVWLDNVMGSELVFQNSSFYSSATHWIFAEIPEGGVMPSLNRCYTSDLGTLKGQSNPHLLDQEAYYIVESLRPLLVDRAHNAIYSYYVTSRDTGSGSPARHAGSGRYYAFDKLLSNAKAHLPSLKSR